jgi:RNA polymerase sigma factor (sigma-70 family)
MGVRFASILGGRVCPAPALGRRGVSISTVATRIHAPGVLIMDLVIGSRRPRRERPAVARSLARREPGLGEDLLQVARVGLVKAFERFDPERGLMFSSFAVSTITGELRRHLRDRSWWLDVPRDGQELSAALGPVAGPLLGELRRSPTDDVPARRVRVSPATVREARQAADTWLGHTFDEPAHADARETLVRSSLEHLQATAARDEERSLVAT